MASTARNGETQARRRAGGQASGANLLLTSCPLWQPVPVGQLGPVRSLRMPRQQALYSTSASRVYVARWALRRNEPRFVDAFAPATYLARVLLLALPLWLLARASGLVAWLLLRFVRSEEITDGNVNFSFAVRGRGGLTLFVKQARPYLKWQPQMSLERDRMAREVRYFREVEATLERHLATRFLPAIHDFDAAHSVLVMDFLADHVVLFEQLFAKRHLPRAAAEGLAERNDHADGCHVPARCALSTPLAADEGRAPRQA